MVYDFLVSSPPSVTDRVIVDINVRSKLGTTAHGPGVLLFFGFNVRQDDKFSFFVRGYDNLDALSPPVISRLRRHQHLDPLNTIYSRSFASLNSSIGWLSITSSVVCSEFSSCLQQKAPIATFLDQVAETNCIRMLQKIGTSSHYPACHDRAPN